jgi:SAM-dependent MidA family methyltransferase
MDSALHDPNFGYYARRVAIGKFGHFDTHPEELSPDYGEWMAVWAFKAWTDLVAHGELADTAEFPVIEFGAGNGRLARDFLGAVAQGADARNGDQRLRWLTFALRVQYRIYERSASLREKQAALLGSTALVLEGDARTPRETLQRDFPRGLTGFVLSNELPDAFGVHKVILDARGSASVALVVPRVESSVKNALGTALAERIEASDRAARADCNLVDNVADFYLDAALRSSPGCGSRKRMSALVRFRTSPRTCEPTQRSMQSPWLLKTRAS